MFARSPRLWTGDEVFTLLPNVERYPQSALVSDCAPPRGIGQPTACAGAAMRIANAALSGSSRLRKEWAAKPANSARVRWLRNRLATDRADRNANIPKRAIRNGCLGMKGTGRSTSGANSLHLS